MEPIPRGRYRTGWKSCSEHDGHDHRCERCHAVSVAAISDNLAAAAVEALAHVHDVEKLVAQLAAEVGQLHAGEMIGRAHTTVRRWAEQDGPLSADLNHIADRLRPRL